MGGLGDKQEGVGEKEKENEREKVRKIRKKNRSHISIFFNGKLTVSLLGTLTGQNLKIGITLEVLNMENDDLEKF